MPVFEYRAVGSNNRVEHGTIDRDSARQARNSLRELGMRVLEITEAKSATRRHTSLAVIPVRQNWNSWIVTFTSELSTLLSVGVPLLDALTTLISQYRGRQESVVRLLKDRVSSGVSFADAMRKQPEVFDILCIKMVEVGEKTGSLDSVLAQLSDFKGRAAEFRDKVTSALLYPAVVLLVSIGVSIFLMTVVVPMLLENLLDAGRPLPIPTRILKWMSDTLLVHGWWMSVVTAFLILLAAVYIRTKNGRRAWDKCLIRVPVLGPLSQKQEISRVALIIATLLKSGVDFVQSIEIAIGTSKNVLLQEALEDCAKQIRSGTDIGIALGKWSYFPPLVAQVFTVGQKSGKLEPMLMRLSKDYDQQVESATGRLATVLEPALILFLSFFVGFILFATLLPILEAGNVL